MQSVLEYWDYRIRCTVGQSWIVYRVTYICWILCIVFWIYEELHGMDTMNSVLDICRVPWMDTVHIVLYKCSVACAGNYARCAGYGAACARIN